MQQRICSGSLDVHDRLVEEQVRSEASTIEAAPPATVVTPAMTPRGLPRRKLSPLAAVPAATGELKQLTVRGGMATFSGQGAKFVLNLGSTVILARLLTPQDFGLIGMVTAVTGFVMMFKDLGLSMATVQRVEINHRQVSTLFWINVAISAVLLLLTVALAPALAWFYEESRLVGITVALSLAFLLGGLTVQHQALLKRQMRLSVVAAIDVAAMAVGVVTAVLAAWANQGYWALVWMQLATATATMAGVWIASDWRPGWPARAEGVRAMLAFGGNLTAFNVLNYFARNFDNVLIGRFAGAGALGLYSRAYSLLLFPIGQITAPMTAVAVPALSRLQSDPVRYSRFYLRAVKVVAYVSMPLVSGMAVLSTEIIGLVLGNDWLGAAPMFMLLAIAALWQPVGATVGWVYVSMDQTRRMFHWSCALTPLTLIAFAIGLKWGAIGVAASYAALNTIQIVPQFWFALRYSPVRLKALLRVIQYPFALSLAMAAPMAIARGHLVHLGSSWTVAGCTAIGIVIAISVAIGTKAIRSDAIEVIDVIRMAFGQTSREEAEPLDASQMGVPG